MYTLIRVLGITGVMYFLQTFKHLLTLIRKAISNARVSR